MTSTTTKTTSRSHYEILDVDKYADTEQIKKAYHKLALKYHPDKSGSNSTIAKFQAISAAYDCLSDAMLRRKYDDHQTRKNLYVESMRASTRSASERKSASKYESGTHSRQSSIFDGASASPRSARTRQSDTDGMSSNYGRQSRHRQSGQLGETGCYYRHYKSNSTRPGEGYFDAPESSLRGSQRQGTHFSTAEFYPKPRADYHDIPREYSDHFHEKATREVPKGILKPPPGQHRGSIHPGFKVDIHIRFSASVEQHPRHVTHRQETQPLSPARANGSHTSRPQYSSPRPQPLRRSSEVPRRSAGASGSYTTRMQEPYRGVDRPALRSKSRSADQSWGGYANSILNAPKSRHSEEFFSGLRSTSSSLHRPSHSNH